MTTTVERVRKLAVLLNRGEAACICHRDALGAWRFMKGDGPIRQDCQIVYQPKGHPGIERLGRPATVLVTKDNLEFVIWRQLHDRRPDRERRGMPEAIVDHRNIQLAGAIEQIRESFLESSFYP